MSSHFYMPSKKWTERHIAEGQGGTVKQAREHLLRNQSVSDRVKEMTLNAGRETDKSYYHLSALHNLF